MGNGEMPAKGTPIEIGKGRVVRRPGASNRGRTKKDRVTILSFGTRLHDALIAAQEVEDSDTDLGVTVADARFMKPLDIDLIRALDDGTLKARCMVIPDTLFEAATQNEQYEEAGLNARHIKGTILRLTERIKVPVLSDQD